MKTAAGEPPQVARFRDEIFALPDNFSGVLRVISGDVASVVAWIGAEMEFALSQAIASGDAFEHRPSECGH